MKTWKEYLGCKTPSSDTNDYEKVINNIGSKNTPFKFVCSTDVEPESTFKKGSTSKMPENIR